MVVQGDALEIRGPLQWEQLMEQLFRRKRLGLLKTVLSLSLFFTSLFLFHKLKLPEDTYTRQAPTCEGCSWWEKGSKPTLTSPNHVTVPSARGAHSNRSAPFWDVQVPNCSKDAAVRTTDWFRRLDPRFHQFVLHRHCRYFPMLINHPEKCTDTGGEVHLLIVVKSIIEQHDRREAVRKTWGREYTAEGKSIKTLFLLGSPSVGKDTKNLQKLIEYEDQIYEDILQWDFMDTFYNLTLKEVNFLKWFDIYCPGVKFIFKGDDDVFMNTNNLLDLISFKVEEHKETTLFVGQAMYRSVPIRNKQSKYYIPRELFDKSYPPYVGGGGFLMSSQMARRLFVVSKDFELFPIDDVFLGMCLQRLHLSPEMHPGFRTFGINARQVSPMNSEPCFYKNLILVHKLSTQELLKMWSLVHNEELVCARRASF